MAGNANPSWGPGECYIGRNNMGLCAGENEDAHGGGGFLRHDSGISLVWTLEEQAILEDFVSRFGKDTILVHFAKIAKALPDKTIRDVALRCRWMSEKEIAKQRKDDWSSLEKNTEEKEYVTDSMLKPSQATNGYNSMMMDCDDGISYKMIDGTSAKLLEQNAQALDQIFANISDSKYDPGYTITRMLLSTLSWIIILQIHENIRLFYQARLNILSILNDGSYMTETMKLMPPLPVQLNEELATTILPLPSSSYMPEMM